MDTAQQIVTQLAHGDLAAVEQRLADLKLVMIGMESDGQTFLQAIREGAMGYVVKDASAMEVAGAISTVASGDAFCSPQLCAFLFRFAAQQNQLPSFHARQRLGLTNRASTNQKQPYRGRS